MSVHNPLDLPPDLPVPVDDGACAHLSGMRMPPVALPSTEGGAVHLSALAGRTVVYCYPRTGRPDQEVPKGWDEIPGARGCTPQSCAFRDHYAAFEALGTRVFGLSTQTTGYQREAVTRLHLPFALLSDADLAFTRALRLPTFEFAWSFGAQLAELIKRLTLVLRDGRIEHVFYPVFPPDKNAERVQAWLTQHPR
ncbi:MAG TPA: peroxiredoxin [bacterium]|nr:peroxiredoxin [bacterium]